MTTFGTKITELQRTVELDSQDVELLDDVRFTSAYDMREEDSVLIAREHDDVVHVTAHFDVVKYVGDSYATGSEIAL